jgi:GT2 family glycosyltransferase
VTSEPPQERVRTAGKFLRAGDQKFLVKGLTYGPFDPGEKTGAGVKRGAALDADLRQITNLGANTLRLYEVPPIEFLDACEHHGLRVLVGVPWPNHVDFVGERGLWDSCVNTLREAVRRLSGHPAVLGYLVGNEIEATLVRWLGPKKVKRLLEELIDAGREEDPDALFAYANYPSTEYLNPENADFLAYNVYLEREVEFGRYLARLQNIAGDKPLLISEFGADSLSLGKGEQRRVVGRGCDTAFTAGAAGFIVFAFTDEWFRGGEEVRGWDFGMVTREREPKPVHEALSRRFKSITTAAHAAPATILPKFSVIVCTHNGERTLGACLDSLSKLRYPDYEVILVDDGSTDMTSDIAKAANSVRYLKQSHSGLSVARNLGAAEATGDVFAYTDDDCVADEDWLHYLAVALEDGEFGCVGGPNIPPPPEVLPEACVAAAPGAPAHVLIDDRRAEHLPGCNLAVRREAFEEVGGFSPIYHAAGDDVDFCWRLIDADIAIGFAPGAMVWHYRRSSVKAYLKQQIGYGKAEALLIGDHPKRFGLLGGARWHGAVYSGRRGALGLSSRIYRGVFGYAPFQSIYTTPESDFFHIATGVQWVLVAGLLLALGISFSSLVPVGLLMLAITLFYAGRESWRARIDPRFAGMKSKLLLALLCLAQPILRGGARTFGTLRRGKAPQGPIWSGKLGRPPKLGLWKRVGKLRLWSESGLARDVLLEKTANTLRRLGWKHSVDNGWKDWDMEIERGFLWRVRMTTVTEYHGGEKCLTRARLTSKATVLNIIGNVVVAAGLFALAWGEPHRVIWLGATYLLWWAFLEVRHRAVVEGLLRLVTNVAQEIGFDRAE